MQIYAKKISYANSFDLFNIRNASIKGLIESKFKDWKYLQFFFHGMKFSAYSHIWLYYFLLTPHMFFVLQSQVI